MALVVLRAVCLTLVRRRPATASVWDLAQHLEGVDRLVVISAALGGICLSRCAGVSVVGVLRKNEFIPNPDASLVFEAGDFIAVIGMPEKKNLFIRTMISL